MNYDKQDIYILGLFLLSIFMIYSAFIKMNDISIITTGYNINEIGEITFENFTEQVKSTEWKKIVFLDFFWKGIIGTFNELITERTRTIEKMVISILFTESHSILQKSLQVCTPNISTTLYDTVHNIISIYSTGMGHTNDCIKTQVEIQIAYIQSKHNAIFNTFMNRMNITVHSAINIFRVGISIGGSTVLYFYYRKYGRLPQIQQNNSTAMMHSKNETVYDIENKLPISRRRKRAIKK
jgi:hypothetical protein